LIERIGLLSRVTVVAACRSFDLKYDERLAERQWTQRLAIGLLDWETEVLPLLTEWGIASNAFSPRLKDLLRNPRLLALFGDMGGVTAGALNIDTEQALTERYLDRVVRDSQALGPAALDDITQIAGQMLSERRLELTRGKRMAKTRRRPEGLRLSSPS